MPGENAKWEGSLPATFNPSPLWFLYLHSEGSDPGMLMGTDISLLEARVSREGQHSLVLGGVFKLGV